jgi:hypothetical protein
MFGLAMSIFARSTAAPSASSPFFIARSRARFSAGVRSRYALSVPGVAKSPRALRISSALRSSTYALPASTSASAARYMKSK